jgi:D-threo-aldose 1-dehydrogenase
MTARKFEKRRVGQTALEVTTLGFGAATIAGSYTPVSAEQARTTVAHALDSGIGYVDTAPHYGFGRSEHFVGDVLRERKGEAVLSTKVGRVMKPVRGPYEHGTEFVDPFPFQRIFDYSYDGIIRSFEDSLQRLGMNSVDIVYVHDLGAGTHSAEGNKPYWAQFTTGGGYRALQELRASGAVKAIGLGVNEWQVLMDAFELGDWDVFLLAGRYTLLEQTSLEPFLSTCVKRGTSVVVGGPFNSGILAGGSTFNYAKAPDEIVAKVKSLAAVCDEFGVPLAAAALQFPLTHPAVCNVVAGPRSPLEIDGILDWWDVKIPGELWTTLAAKGLLAPGTPIPGGTA